MTAFRSEADVFSWLDAEGLSLGALVTTQTLYHLGRDWYGTRMDLDWQPATETEATDMFAKHGLVGDFWSLV